MNFSKKIYLLIGAKGSGKSYIGGLFQQYFNIPFIRVEDWVKEIKSNRNVDDLNYLLEVFDTIELGIRKSLLNLDSLVFESTGLSEQFDKMLENLKSDFEVCTIKIVATPELCLQRVQSRDHSIHINISDVDVLRINHAFVDKNMNCDFQIENDEKTVEQLITEISNIITPSI